MPKRVDFEGFKLDLELPSNVDSEIDAGNWFDKEVSIWIKHYVRPGMVCIDAGANWGLFTLLMSREVGPTGKVFAFEPATAFYNRLVEHVLLNQITNSDTIPMALSDINGHVICNTEGPPYHSSARIDFARENVEFEGDEVVRSDTLDHWWRPPVCKLNFIKIDVDGSEYRLLLGAAKVIETHRPIIVCEMEIGQPGFDAIQWLSGRGYRFEIYQGRKVTSSYVREQVGKGAGSVNLLAMPN